ncbi:uncharacterized protein LOC142235997 [Haematobia irritans]|uniref:uncharacterized protein LOC142235997 n=1 Tax=Haematobia irritans TaxID=7368 RepID=UPI003F4FD4E6
MSVSEKFTNAFNDLMDFEQAESNRPAEKDVHSLDVLRVHVDHLWTQVQRSYEICRDYKAPEGEKPIDLKILRETYRKALSSYKLVVSSLNAEKEALSSLNHPPEKSERLSAPSPAGFDRSHEYAIKLPPCDTDVFYGSYKTWPTFRDLFSAIYIKNPRLSGVEKLYHLNQKTGGEAREIISHVPLVNEGFDIAWKSLADRYENKRMQVNEQIRILFDLPAVSVHSSSSLKLLQRTVTGCLQTLKTLDIITTSWDPILIYLCSQKLPRNYLEDFEKNLDDSSQMPSWRNFDDFLTQKFKTLESVGNVQPSTSKSNSKPQEKTYNPKDRRIHTFQTKIEEKTKMRPNSKKTPQPLTTVTCQLCKESHTLGKCPKFLEKNINDRIHFVKNSRSCFNCLTADHHIKDCKSNYNCRTCNQRHHTLLHKGNGASTMSLEQDASVRPSTSAQAFTTTIQSIPDTEQPHITTLALREANRPALRPQSRETLLFTALVEIESNGQRYEARAIIDPGSQSTFISDKLKNRLRLPTKRNLVHVSGLSPTVTETSTQACIFTLCSKVEPNFKLDVLAPVLKTLPFNLPPKDLDIDISTFEQPLADPYFYVSQSIDILIGLDLGPSIFDVAAPIRPLGSLLAQKTVFGWIVGGPVEKSTESKNEISLFNAVALDKILTQFWEVEETPKPILRSEEDKTCETIFQTTTYRNSSGRFVVTLPFKNGVEIGHSRSIAMAQFLRMEKMLSTKPDIKHQYDQVILEYLDLGHMRKIHHSEIQKRPNYYLPHHAVIKPDRVTTKLRVVFNASSPTSNKKSLNDILYPGPILQQDLVLQTLKWRLFKYVYNADITKMYRQILVDPSQTQYQRILFRKSPKDPIEDFELQTVTFGVNCAPFLAIRTLLQLAEDVRHSHPLAAKVLEENMYVDDVLAGGHTVNEAIISRKQLESALLSAGFDLMKWTSNDPQVIKDLPEEKLLSLDCLTLSENIGTKTLGIKWDIKADSFSFPQPEIIIKPSYTKREVLSTIARFFDPCGWLAPIIIVAKLIMQQIWLDKVGWDDGLTPLTCITWQNFLKTCPDIQSVKIPRWVQFTPESKVELHGFCDSSEKAYAATLYIRLETGNDIKCHLLVAKTRVAPIKKLSLPRLELCGAVLLSTLVSSTVPRLQLTSYDLHFWTDSTIVLSWLNRPSCTWNTFVGNRVAEITEKVGTSNWRHVESRYNPADIATRGCSSTDLQTYDLWWYGPSWLKEPKSRWPVPKQMVETTLEIKPVKTFFTTTYEDPLERFSSLSRAYRVLSYVFRFWRNTGSKRIHLRSTSTEISSDEIKFVKTRLIIITQRHNFGEEYTQLSKKLQIASTSSLLTLNPFVDTFGIMRSNGRLTKSPSLTFNERHPILIPHDCRLARLLVEHTHKSTLHGGSQLMIRILRTEFWIFRLKPLVKFVINHCKTCILYKKHTRNQIMASLPPERSTFTRPFQNTGVDFAGPFNIRNYTGRACLITKGYVCIFVCFSTKAVHLEATSDLSTQAFLAAFARFIGRRGCPAKMFSDNGTNFTGAAEMLKKDRIEFFRHLQSDLITRHSSQDIEWNFIPPGAPHMGGLWEAGVKSFKSHLKRAIPDMTFTFEELSTILARIESCLNSRPLSPANDDPNDLSPLTPGHFLIGAPILSPAEPDLSSDNITLANRWKRLKIISQQFCQRWKTEYLRELHRRYKWKRPQENVKMNDLVIIKDDRLPPNDWKLGRIIHLYPGSDDNSRVVDLKTSNGVIRRPITKLIPLLSN